MCARGSRVFAFFFPHGFRAVLFSILAFLLSDCERAPFDDFLAFDFLERRDFAVVLVAFEFSLSFPSELQRLRRYLHVVVDFLFLAVRIHAQLRRNRRAVRVPVLGFGFFFYAL